MIFLCFLPLHLDQYTFLALNDLLINLWNSILNFHLLAGDVLPTRESHVHCTRSFVIAPFVIPQLVSFVFRVTTGRVELIRNGQLFFLALLIRQTSIIAKLFGPSIAFAAATVPACLLLPCACTGW